MLCIRGVARGPKRTITTLKSFAFSSLATFAENQETQLVRLCFYCLFGLTHSVQ